MNEKIALLEEQFQAELSGLKNSKQVEDLKVRYLGRKGPIQDLMQNLRDLSSEERPLFGKRVNDLKEKVHALLEEKESYFKSQENSSRLEEEKIDITLPGRPHYISRKHVITQMLDEVIDIFISMGFSVQYGPDIDTDYYNFEGLNFPPDHPARDMQDTFYLSPSWLLRTHTSNTELHVMQKHQPPLRFIAPGKCYRNETISSRSHVQFHQVEGVYIDEKATFADLFATMEDFLNKLFKRKVETRFRPSFFPFVEPGLEVDIRCTTCEGKGCRLCKHSGWLEITGAGMLHPEVLKNGGIDPEKYSGYAWGMGIERLALLRYGITDIRLFTENDLRFLEQFNAI
jgi:phenylalanyl-tRNA synthetase alpha chain